MKKSNLLSLVIVVLIVGLGIWFLLANNNTPKKATSLKEVKVGYLNDDYVTNGLISLADEKGYFTANGIKVTKSPGTSDFTNALLAGQVDVNITSTPIALLNYLNTNSGIVFVDQLGTRPALMGIVAKQGDITKMTKAGVSKLGSGPQIYTEIIQGNLGMANKLTYVIAPTGEPQLAAIKKGLMDFVVGNHFTASITQTLASSNFQVIAPEAAWGDRLAPVGVLTTSKELSTDKAAIKGFVTAINTAENYAQNHQSEFKTEIASQSGLTSTVSQEVITEFVNTLPKSHSLTSADLQDALVAIKTLFPTTPSRSLSGFINNSLLAQ